MLRACIRGVDTKKFFPTQKIFSVCSDGPPTNPGVSFIPLDEYPNNVFVPYFCLNNGILSPSTATNQCVNGAWVSSSPSCFSKSSIVWKAKIRLWERRFALTKNSIH